VSGAGSNANTPIRVEEKAAEIRQSEDFEAVALGLGRIAALHYCSSTLYHIRKDNRWPFSEATMRPNSRWRGTSATWRTAGCRRRTVPR
jgi:hypothetical protein